MACSFAVRPWIKDIEIFLGLNWRASDRGAAGVLVVFLDDVIAIRLRLAVQERLEAAAIQTGWMRDADDIEQCGQEIDGRDHVLAIDRAGLGNARPANDERRLRAAVIKLRFDKRHPHAVVGQENHECVIGLAGLSALPNAADGIIGSAHGGIIVRKFGPHGGVVEQVAGNRHFLWLEDSRWLVRIVDSPAATAFAVKRLVRIGDVDHQAKRLAGLLCGGDAALGRMFYSWPDLSGSGMFVARSRSSTRSQAG